MHVDLSTLVLPLKLRMRQAQHLLPCIFLTVMQSAILHLGSFLHCPLWLNADLLTFNAAFLSELSAQIPDFGGGGDRGMRGWSVMKGWIWASNILCF